MNSEQQRPTDQLVFIELGSGYNFVYWTTKNRGSHQSRTIFTDHKIWSQSHTNTFYKWQVRNHTTCKLLLQNLTVIMRVELLSFMITGVMDHRVLGNRSRSYLAMEQLEEALRDTELCCKLRPSWAKVKREVGDYSLTPRHLPPPVFKMPIQRGRPSDSVCVCHYITPNSLLLYPTLPSFQAFTTSTIQRGRQSSHVLWC